MFKLGGLLLMHILLNNFLMKTTLILLLLIIVVSCGSNKQYTQLELEGIQGSVKQIDNYSIPVDSISGIDTLSMFTHYHLYKSVIGNSEGFVTSKKSYSRGKIVSSLEKELDENNYLKILKSFDKNNELVLSLEFHFDEKQNALIGVNSKEGINKKELTSLIQYDDERKVSFEYSIENEADTHYYYIKEYNDFGRVVRLESREFSFPGFVEIKRYSDKNNLVELVSISDADYMNYSYSYTYIKYDSQGNWIYRIVHNDENEDVLEYRNIQYFE